MATENTSSIISSIYKSRNIILEMMASQNYNTDEYNGFNINDINSMVKNASGIINKSKSMQQ